MASRQFVFRLSSEGGQQVIDDLKKIAATTPEAERALRSLTQASPQLASVADGVAVKIKAASAALDTHAASAGNAAFATRQLGVQSIQFFSSIASGAPIMTAFVQQGHQVVDVALSTGTGFGVLRTAAAALFSVLASPIAIGVGIAAAVVAVGVAAEVTERRIGTLRNQLSLVRTDFQSASVAADDAAKHLAATTTLSTSDARAGINAVFGQGQFTGTPAQAEALVQVNARLSRQLGEVAINAQRAGQIIADPAGVLGQLLKDHPGITAFNQQLVDTVKHLQESGQQGEAVSKAIAALNALTKNESDAVSELQRATQGLSQAFTSGGQSGRGFADTIGGTVDSVVARFIRGVTNVVTALTDAGNWLDRHGLGIGGANNTGATGAAGQAVGNIPTDASNEIYKIAERLGARPELADFATRIAQIESGGQQFNPAGGVLTSSAGALGMMQVMPGTARGLDLNDRSQNIEAGLRELMSLDQKFGGDLAKIAIGYNAGPGRVGSGNLPPETQAYLAKLGLQAPAGGAASTAIASNKAADLAAAGLLENTPSARRQKAEEDMGKAQRARDLPGLDAEHFKEADQALEEATKRYYDAVTASEALERSVHNQTTAEGRLTAAWGEGSVAAAHMVNQLKAEDAVRGTLNPNTEKSQIVIERLAAAYDELGAKQERAKLAEAGSVTTDQVALIQKQIDTIGMEGTAREALIQHMKNEQDVARQFPLVSQAERDARVKQLDGVNQLTQALQRQQQAVDEVANVFSSSFDQVGQAITTTLVQGGQAAINWQNVMNGVAQSVMQGFLKLAVLNPILNQLFGGTHRPELLDAGGGSGLIGQALKALGIGGSGAATAGVESAAASSASQVAFAQSLGVQFAGGGVMTRWGPIPLNRYAGGGIADRPQMAMFGEGSMPEAYVPLPDGRSIPVSMRGGGTVVHQGDVNVHVANSNASAAMIGVTVQLAVKQANAELLAQIERGGAIAKKVGRRR